VPTEADDEDAGQRSGEQGGNGETPHPLAFYRIPNPELRIPAQLGSQLRPDAVLRRLQRQRAQGVGEIQLAVAIMHDMGPTDGSRISRRRCVPRATWDLEKLTVLPTMPAISGCE